MRDNFWFLFAFGFTYLFPLAFTYIGYMGEEINNPIVSTISFVVAIILWLFFIYNQIKQEFIRPRSLVKSASILQTNGQLVQAEIVDIINKQQTEEGYVVTEFLATFPNLVGTSIEGDFELTDSKPHLQRYEIGKHISIRLNTDPMPKIPWMFAEGQIMSNLKTRKWIVVFTVIYAIATFIFFNNDTIIFENLDEWKDLFADLDKNTATFLPWLSFFHPWFWTPIVGIFFSYLMGKAFNTTFTDEDIQANKLLLYGHSADAKITRMEQTGLHVNDQPQFLIKLKYTDQQGREHFTEMKKIIPLHEMHRFQEGQMIILYLPHATNQIMFL